MSGRLRWVMLALAFAGCETTDSDGDAATDGGVDGTVDMAPTDGAPADAAPVDAMGGDAEPDAEPDDAGREDAGADSSADAAPDAAVDAGCFGEDPDNDGVLASCDVCPDADDNGDADGDGTICALDCDDDDATAFPGAAERCNDLDDDCDDEIDEDVECVPAGTLDPAFAEAGVFVQAMGIAAEARALRVDADGAISIAGAVREAAGGWNMLSARLTAAGALDVDYSDDGWTSVDFAGGADQANALAVGPDGTQVLAGFRTDGTANPAIAQLTPAGVPDPAFGGGRVVPAGLESGTFDGIDLRDGGLVAAGEVRTVGQRSVAVVAWLTAAGALDPAIAGGIARFAEPFDVRVDHSVGSAAGSKAFVGHHEGGADDSAILTVVGADGAERFTRTVDVHDDASRDRFLGMAKTTDGFALVGESDGDLLIYKTDAEGMPVAGFGEDGRVVLDISEDRDRAFSVVEQPDGKLLVAGSARVAGVSKFLVLRLDAMGALDATFGEGGQVLLDFGNAAQDAVAQAIALDPTQLAVVVAGHVGEGDAERIAVVRLGR